MLLDLLYRLILFVIVWKLSVCQITFTYQVRLAHNDLGDVHRYFVLCRLTSFRIKDVRIQRSSSFLNLSNPLELLDVFHGGIELLNAVFIFLNKLFPFKKHLAFDLLYSKSGLVAKLAQIFYLHGLMSHAVLQGYHFIEKVCLLLCEPA